ncbi:MAG: gamma-glutamylcyclotransferase [Sulfobacillus sp.]|nr:gamma-glutamylcyclotransferase [Sulfobacillus sp.]
MIGLEVFVNGELMQGLSMHHFLTGARYIRSARTAPIYRLFSIDDQYPAMVMAGRFERGYAIAGEIYDVPDNLWPEIVANERRLGLYRGPIWLEDGEATGGILSVRELCEGYPDISHFGDWREYRQTLTR